MSIARVAVAQASTVPYDSRAAVGIVREWAAKASAAGAELVVFPEAFVGGYPKGSRFGAVVGNRTREGRDEYLRYARAAIIVPGPQTDDIGQSARDHHLHIVVGVIERDGGTLYCTVLHFDDQGHLLGKRRKLMPTAAERLIWGYGDGSTMDVYSTSIGRIGSVLCFENLMPAARLSMYEQGIEIYCAPTAVDSEPHHATMRHIAQEGRCFVLSANQFMTVADFPDGSASHALGSDPSSVVSNGGSAIIDPLGNVLAGPIYGEEALLLADLQLDDIPRTKYDLDVVGHYSRPDVFHVSTNRRQQRPVINQYLRPEAAHDFLRRQTDETHSHDI